MVKFKTYSEASILSQRMKRSSFERQINLKTVTKGDTHGFKELNQDSYEYEWWRPVGIRLYCMFPEKTSQLMFWGVEGIQFTFSL